ncbi:MAG TPA: hypothetical protein VM008_19480 [Phycisphaerae bacterium]|nr:hypothetical protein [Phycisphaerae bacterium]
MKLTNDTYLILLRTKNFTERYYRDKTGWLKVSARGNKFRMTAEQLLNHLLPALAGIHPSITVTVKHREPRATPKPRPRRATPLKPKSR